MQKLLPFIIVCCCALAGSVHAEIPSFAPVSNNPHSRPAKPEKVLTHFVVRDASGNSTSVPLVDDSAKRKIVPGKIDRKMDPTMMRAATIAQERAHAHSKSRCWRYVKEALLAAGAVDSYPKTALAKQAGTELVEHYGFKKLPVCDPYAAPVGAVLVYGGKGAGHVEIRNKTGFVSDFRNTAPSKRRLIGVYAKG